MLPSFAGLGAASFYVCLDTYSEGNRADIIAVQREIYETPCCCGVCGTDVLTGRHRKWIVFLQYSWMNLNSCLLYYTVGWFLVLFTQGDKRITSLQSFQCIDYSWSNFIEYLVSCNSIKYELDGKQWQVNRQLE